MNRLILSSMLFKGPKITGQITQAKITEPYILVEIKAVIRGLISIQPKKK